jgi:hypothetical protein
MESDNPNKGKHARGPEIYSIDSTLKENLGRSLNTVDNVLAALTHTGQEGLLRDKRIEEIEKMRVPIFDYLEHGNQEAANDLRESAARLLQSQYAITETRSTIMREIAIQEIVEHLNEITEAGYAVQITPPVAQALNIQQETVYQLSLLNGEIHLRDSPITGRIIGIKEGIEAAIIQNDTAPLRFIQRGLEGLRFDAKEIDEQMTNMPEKNQRWKMVQAENNKLRQLMTQFI